MKRLLSLVVLAACVAMAGCEINVHPRRQPVQLDGQEFVKTAISPTVGSYSMQISGGSGHYFLTVDDPTTLDDPKVAEARVELRHGTEAVLVIVPKNEGKTEIIVYDDLSNTSAKCELTVTLAARRISYRFSDIATNVDADAPEAIEADLAADTRWTKDGGVDFVGSYNDVYPPGEYRLDILFVGADNRDVATGTLGLGETGVEWNPAFDFMPVGGKQMEPAKRFVFTRGTEEWTVDYYVVEGVHTRMPSPVRAYHRRFYEDLTEYYKAKYPDAGVRSVARVVFSNIEW